MIINYPLNELEMFKLAIWNSKYNIVHVHLTKQGYTGIDFLEPCTPTTMTHFSNRHWVNNILITSKLL